MKLGFFKLTDDVPVPEMKTRGSACFDIAYWPPHPDVNLEVYKETNQFVERPLGDDQKAIIMPGERVVMPTSLILDIPEDHSVRLHPRSSVSIKKGLCLANSEAVIDYDYVNQLFVCLINNSSNRILIERGERIAQG